MMMFCIVQNDDGLYSTKWRKKRRFFSQSYLAGRVGVCRDEIVRDRVVVHVVDEVINPAAIEQILDLNEKTVDQLKKITSYDFDIFDLRANTNENELITVVSHILAKESLFDMLPINNEKFMNFIHKVQDTYTDITYHNKTHGADLA